MTTHFLSPFSPFSPPCCPAAPPPPVRARPKPSDRWLNVVTSVHAALLAASKSRSCCFDFLPLALLRAAHPRRFASAMFLAALRSARLCFLFRLGTRLPDEMDPGPGPLGGGMRWLDAVLMIVSRRSAVGRRTAACVEGRGWRGMGARMVVSARRPEERRSIESKAPVTPLGVLMIRGMSSTGVPGAMCGWKVEFRFCA